MPSDASALRRLLRDGTRDLHDRTESAFVLGADDLTRDEYVAVLGRMLGLYASAEAALAPWAADLAHYGLDLPARRKVPHLRRDLDALTSDGANVDPAPNVSSVAHAFGVLYVLEGATLGGQLLRRRVEAQLHLTPAAGLAFLSAYGANVGPMWRAYGDALDRFDAALATSTRAAAHAAALAGARATFLAFERWVVAPTARRTAAVPA